jgi:hypothetical protein
MSVRHTFLLSTMLVAAFVGCGGRDASIGSGTGTGTGNGNGSGSGSGTQIGDGSHDGENTHGNGTGGSDAGQADADSGKRVETSCGTTTCVGSDVCVVTMSGGGPCLQPDPSGNCPDGLPPSGGCCNRTTTTYECKPLPSSCGGTLSCDCAQSLCQCGGCGLSEQPNTMSCGCFYP